MLTLLTSYLIADYDRGNFSISQCSWDPNAKQSVIPIYPPAPLTSLTPSTPIPTSNPPSSSSSSPSTGAIAGIVTGVVLFLLLALLTLYILVLKPRRTRKKAAAASLAHPPDDKNDIMILKPELDAQDVGAHEMEGEHCAEADGGSSGMVLEMEGKAETVFELPAREEVAVEVGDGKGEAAELQGGSVRRKFSWEGFENQK